MSCFNGNCYLPQPPRAWSRVQNSCSLITDTDNNGLVRDPYTGQLVPAIVLAERIAMLNKGNILQYKANSSNLTKSQKYSKIAKGQWVNRNTTWATQSTRGYTNPNTTSLKRTENAINIAIDPITGAIIGPTTEPVTCLKPVVPVNEGLPPNEDGGAIEPEIPPPVEPTPESDVFPPIVTETPLEPIVIQDGGNLICSVQENICTGETKQSVSQQLCHPTTDSDVPGPIQDLCWNDGTQTWYPRQRYIMTNSANKWPTNATLVSAVKPCNSTNGIYIITGDSNYTEEIIGNQYTLTFNANTDGDGNFTITFFIDVNNVSFTLVGGGGGGRGSGYYPEEIPNTELLVGGVGGGGASSIQSFVNVQPSSFNLIVGKGGSGGLTSSGPPQGTPGNITIVSGNTFNSTAPGGKTSTSIGSEPTDLGNVYYAIGVLSSDAPTTSGTIIASSIGGGSYDGSGIIYVNPNSNRYSSGGNGYDAVGTLNYGGGGGTTTMTDNPGKTFTGSQVYADNSSGNKQGGFQGTLQSGYQSTYLDGNQQKSGYGSTTSPGFGSGGGGGGLFWQFNGNDYFGLGGNGGDGLIIITFTYP